MSHASGSRAPVPVESAATRRCSEQTVQQVTSTLRFRASRQQGFTLLELVITMTIAAILLAIGIPSFRYVTTANRMSGEINGLLADMLFARSEAIKEGQTVTVCASANGQTCSGAATWNTGWIVFPGTGNPANVNAVLRVQGNFNGGDTLQPTDATTSAVQFNREGFALGLPGAVTVDLHDSTNNPAYTRCLQISVVGALSTLNHDVNNCP